MRKPNHVPNVAEIFTSCGSRKKAIYTPRFDGECLSLRQTGSIDIQDSINSYAPYCDIGYMLNRLKVGDSSVLSSRPASYGDFTGLPGNPVDTLNLIHDVERSFAELPDDVRLACNNDWRVYFTRLCTGDLNDTSGNSTDIPTPDPVPSDSIKEV